MITSEIIANACAKLVREHNLTVEKLTEKQLAEAIRQAILAGDFECHSMIDQSAQQVTYLPYLESERLREEVKAVREALAIAAQALDDWIITYAGADWCGEEAVQTAWKRIMDNGGTIAYATATRDRLSTFQTQTAAAKTSTLNRRNPIDHAGQGRPGAALPAGAPGTLQDSHSGSPAITPAPVNARITQEENASGAPVQAQLPGSDGVT